MKLTNPVTPDSERVVLSGSILSPDALAIASGLLKPDDFSDTTYSKVFDVILSMSRRDIPVEPLSLANELREKGLLNRLGGQSFIAELVGSVASTANIEYHAKVVRENAIRRKLVLAGETISKMAGNLEKSLPSIIGDAEKLLFDADQRKTADECYQVRTLIDPVFASIQTKHASDTSLVYGYSTGFTDIDSLTGGLQPGSLNIIAARPSMGKTALALNIAQFGGNGDNLPVLVFSLEMPANQIVQRMISAECGIDLSALARGTFPSASFQDIKNACDTLAGREIYINDATQLSALEFRARCRKFKLRHPDLALIVVDYLQLMSSGERRTEGRQQEVSDISRMLKAVAREINCPVIALSQLSRASEQRSDKKPQLADLRDSGAIEQDADLVMMIFREDYYGDNERNNLTDSEADIRIAKNRNGGTGVVKLTFRREITRFLNHGDLPPE